MKKDFILLFILGITFFSFSSSLDNDFTNWDDRAYLLGNQNVRGLDIYHITRIFTSVVLGNYNPLTIFSFAIEYHFFGYNSFIYHLDNLLLHLGVTALIFLFALQWGLNMRAAALATLLFGIHPMHVESVAWVTARKDVLYSIFYMLALCQYLRYLKHRRWGAYGLSICFCLMSLLAKPMALSLPLIFLVCDWFKERKLEMRIFIEKVPHLIFIIPIVWITYSLNVRIPGKDVLESALIWTWTLTFYIKKFLFPFILIPLYQLPEPISVFNDQYVISIGLSLFLVLGLFYLRKNRWFIFSFLFFFVSIFFLLRFDNLRDISIVADRFMYLPGLGFCVFFGVYCDKVLTSLVEERGGYRYMRQGPIKRIAF